MKKSLSLAFTGFAITTIISSAAFAAPAETPEAINPPVHTSPTAKATSPALQPASEPAVLAKVNGKEITKAEMDKILSGMSLPQNQGKAATFDKLPLGFQKAFLDRYIEKQLVLDAADKAGLRNDPAIKQKLKETEDLLIQQKYLSDLVAKQKTDDKLKKIYDDKIKSQQGKSEIHALHILVKDESEAKAIREQIQKGTDFEKLAKEKSTEPGAKVNGGDLGYFTADQMVPDFSKAAFALKVNEVSQPVKTPFGWHIIKVIDIRKKPVPTFEESKSNLEGLFASQVISDEAAKLKNQANIQYFGELDKVPSRPATGTPVTKKLDPKTGQTVSVPNPTKASKPADAESSDAKTDKPAKE